MATSTRTAAHAQDPLDKAFARLEGLSPPRLRRALIWLHGPKARKVRIPLGILCLIAGLLWFLPVAGLQFLPIGLLIIAQDVPFLRRPVGVATLRVLDWAERLIKRWKAHRRKHAR